MRLLFLAPFGFICAAIAAAATLVLGFFDFENHADLFVPFIITVGVTTVWTATVAILPATIAIAVAEAFAWRSVLYYFLAGSIIALVAEQVSGLVIEPTFPGQRLAVMLAAGFIGGFVYWAIAGRRAGDWGTPVKPPARPARID